MNVIDTALFALDAYNRAEATDDLTIPYGAEVILDRVEGQFAAVAYYLANSNEIIVAYRGTDNPGMDGATGWPIGSGQYDWAASQADQAFRFYNDLQMLVADTAHIAHSATLSFTGHSLGGGLAGLVASINHLPAYVFDSMPFTEAATKLYQDVSGSSASSYAYWSALAFPDGDIQAPSFSNILSVGIQDEILQNLRWGLPFSVGDHGVVVTSGLDGQIIEQMQIKAGTVSDAVNLHSQALMTIALHGGLFHSQLRKDGGNAIYHNLFDNSLATSLGFTDAEALRQHLAYSLDDDVVALDGLFSDMDALGKLVQSNSTHAEALAKLSIIQAVRIAEADGNVFRLGLIEFESGIANVALAGTYDAAQLINDFADFSSHGFGGGLSSIQNLSNLAVSASGYGGEARLLAGGTLYFGSMFNDDIYGSDDDDIIISLGSDGAFYDTIRGGGGDDIIHGSAGSDIIYDGTGSDIMFGNGGNDTFHLHALGEGEENEIDGGDAIDTITDGNAWADFEITFAGERYHFVLRDSGSVPRMHIVQNVELFELDGEAFSAGDLLNVGPDGSAFSAGGVFSEGTQFSAGAEVARLKGIDGNAFDILSFSLHADSLRYFYLEGNVVRARYAMDLDWSEYVGFLGAEGISDLQNGVSGQTWWADDAAFMDSHYVVKVIVSDSYSVTTLTTLVIHVNNAAPVISVPTVSFAENLPAGRVLGTASGLDPDSSTFAVTWSLAGSAAHLFSIDADGVITTAALIDYEQWSVEGHGDVFVVATDRTGLSTSQALNFTVTNVNEAPTSIAWYSGNGTVLENSPGSTVIGRLLASDPDNNVQSYKIVGSTSPFQISTASVDGKLVGILSVRAGFVIDFEAGSAINVLVEAIDQNGKSALFNVPITVIDVPEIDGTPGVDFLTGTAIGETIHGLGGDDHIWGMGGNDLLYGDAGKDTLFAGEGRDILYGGADNDTFIIDGDDLVRDVFYGDAGIDTVSVIGSAEFNFTDAAVAAAKAEFSSAPGGSMFAISSGTSSALANGIEKIVGGAGSSLVMTSPYALAGVITVDFTAGGGNSATILATSNFAGLTLTAMGGFWRATLDVMTTIDGVELWSLGSVGTEVKFIPTGQGGAITVDGGAGSDTADFSSYGGGMTYDFSVPSLLVDGITLTNFEIFKAGSGGDTFIGGSQRVTFHGGIGRDVYVSHEAADIIKDPDNAVLDYSGSNSSVSVQFSNDYYLGLLYSGTGGHAQGDKVMLGAGNARMEIVGSEFNDVLQLGHTGILRGGAGNDTLMGSAFNDDLQGGTGFDTIILSGGTDILRFSATGGRLDCSSATGATSINQATGIATAMMNGVVKTDTLDGRVLQVVGSSHADSITGSDLDDIIDGGWGYGYDVIRGEGGNDTINIWKGIAHGGADADMLTAGGTNVILNGDGGDDTLVATQSASGSILDGGAGADILKTATDATLIGGAGGDTFINTSSGYSLVSYLTSDGAVNLSQAGNSFLTSGGDADGDTFTGKFMFRGSEYGDVLHFPSAPGVWGGGGDDDIVASGYQAVAYGEEGNDTIRVTNGTAYGGTGNDTITGQFGSVYGDSGDDQLYLLATDTGSFGIVWTGVTAHGGTGKNTIYGCIGDDSVFMGEGEDTFITWGGRQDRLYGVGSNDTIRIIRENVTSMDDVDVIQAGSNLQLDFEGGSILFVGLSLSALPSIEFDFM